ncbi:MAG: GTPase Era [Arenicellales bacterium]
MTDHSNTPQKKTSKTFGFVALIGPPNAGKSTLMNHMIGQKVAITSRKPQTTRHRILGIKTTDEAQIVFVDTPGIHAAGKRELNKMINKTAINSMEDVDLILFMMDDRGWSPEIELAFAAIGQPKVPVFLLINKVDKLRDKKALLPLIETVKSRYDFAQIIPISAQQIKDTNALWETLVKALPKDDLGYGFPVGQITDKSQRFLASELVREQIFRQLGQELPYATAVEVLEFTVDEGNFISTDMVIWVDRDGQKGIIVGKKGAKLKEIGTRAREQMQAMFGVRVNVTLWVKVRKGWADNARMLKSLGYTEL